MNKRKTNYIFKTYISNQEIYGDEANGVIFINEGTNPVTINGSILLASNTSLALNGNIGDCDTTKYTVRFTGAGTNILQVIKKFTD